MATIKIHCLRLYDINSLPETVDRAPSFSLSPDLDLRHGATIDKTVRDIVDAHASGISSGKRLGTSLSQLRSAPCSAICGVGSEMLPMRGYGRAARALR